MNQSKRIKNLEEELNKLVSNKSLKEAKDTSIVDAFVSGAPTAARKKRKKIKKSKIPKYFTERTGLDPAKANTTAERIQQIMAELSTYRGTPLEGGTRAKELKKELSALSGTGIWAKTKFFCRNSPRLCIFLGISAAVLAYFGIKKIGEKFELFDKKEEPSPKPVKPEIGGGGGGGYVACSGPLKRGCKGDNVKDLQQKLLDCGYQLPRKGVDGLFGPETKSAVMSFQKDNSLTVDGVAGPQTMQALDNCGSSTKPLKPVEGATSLTPSLMTTRTFKEEEPALQGQEVEGGVVKENITSIKHIKNRNNSIENLVFERLVKNAN